MNYTVSLCGGGADNKQACENQHKHQTYGNKLFHVFSPYISFLYLRAIICPYLLFPVRAQKDGA